MAKAMRKFGMRPADRLLPVMIDETGRMLKDEEMLNELAKPIWQRNAPICMGDDCPRYTSWQQGKEYFDHFGISAPTMPTVCSIDPDYAVPSSSRVWNQHCNGVEKTKIWPLPDIGKRTIKTISDLYVLTP